MEQFTDRYNPPYYDNILRDTTITEAQRTEFLRQVDEHDRAVDYKIEAQEAIEAEVSE